MHTERIYLSSIYLPVIFTISCFVSIGKLVGLQILSSPCVHALSNARTVSKASISKLHAPVRELVDDKIAVKEVPKDLKKLATKVLETEQVAESKVASKAKAVTDSVKKDVKKAADNVSADVSKAAESVSKESEKTIDAAKDTIDLVRSLWRYCGSCC